MEDFNIKDIVNTLTGADEDGNARAFSTLQHQKLYIDGDDIDTEVIDEAITNFAVVGISVSQGMVTAALQFNSFDDVDFIRMHTVCKNYANREFGEQTELLALTLVDDETFENVVSMVVELVSFDGAEPIIRFIGNSDNTSAFIIEHEAEDDDEEFDDYYNDEYEYNENDEDYEDYEGD